MSTRLPSDSPPASENSRLPELLAPAGDWDCARAAVENGADAIYFGLEKFNARMRARNFTEGDLPRLMEFLHGRGVKGYVTFNTLVFEDEMEAAEKHLRAIISAGVDAAIVQDVGICLLIRRLSPDFPIHVSTQMTITSPAGIEFARQLGCNLVVLARECSLKEIAAMVSGGGLPVEVFVHGALCVAYSGQCLTSEALGGRSANRGECAQACRMPYQLVADGRLVPLGDRAYLLSPQDLAGLKLVPDLISAGVASLKIEGRLKSAEYVASITRIYREALDTCRSRPESASVSYGAGARTESDLRTRMVAPLTPALSPSEGERENHRQPSGEYYLTARKELRRDRDWYEMEMAFSRGLYTGWLGGINNQALVHGRFGKKRGVFLGTVLGFRKEAVVVALQGPLKPGDGVVFDCGKPEEREEGGRVYDVRPESTPQVPGPRRRSGSTGWSCQPENRVLVSFETGGIDFKRVAVGARVWKTSDPELAANLRRSFAGTAPKLQRPICIEAHGAAGGPLTLIARDGLGNAARAESVMALVRADRQPITSELLRQQLGRLGGTSFKLGALENRLEGDLLLPVSELNRLRRRLVREMENLRARPAKWTLVAQVSKPAVSRVSNPADRPFRAARRELSATDDRATLADSEIGDTADLEVCATQQTCASGRGGPRLIVLVRRLPQLEAAVRAGIRTIYCELEDPKKYREAVAIFRGLAKSPPITGRTGLPEDGRSADEKPSNRGETSVPAQLSCRDVAADRNVCGPEIFVAPPRIFKIGEEWILRQVLSSGADGYLVRNYDHLRFFADERRIGDYSLNIANRLSADYFKNGFGLERITASYDLNFRQLQSLVQAAPPEWFEVTLHQHIPMFHMEHCVFCAFLSSGTDYTNCGRPCDEHEVRLRDRVGVEHAVRADAGCRNTVFNARAQTGAECAPALIAMGVRDFRLEFLDEPAEQVTRTISMYERLLKGELRGTDLWRELKLVNQLGVTRGTMGSTSRRSEGR